MKRKQIINHLWDRPYRQLKAQYQLGDRRWDQLQVKLSDQLEDQLREQLEDQIWEQFEEYE